MINWSRFQICRWFMSSSILFIIDMGPIIIIIINWMSNFFSFSLYTQMILFTYRWSLLNLINVPNEEMSIVYIHVFFCFVLNVHVNVSPRIYVQFAAINLFYSITILSMIVSIYYNSLTNCLRTNFIPFRINELCVCVCARVCLCIWV